MDAFVAIDFETADPKRDSACAVGLARAEGGRIVYRDSALIRPPRGVHPMNQRVHGLSWDAVKDAPPFAQVWDKLSPVLAGATRLVAHNASFDRTVLNACCCLADVEPPALEWVCTLKLSVKRFPELASHRLPDVCRHLGIPFANHHDAGADAEAAARVLIALEAEHRKPSVPSPAQWQPSGPVGAILDEIPREHRTGPVLALMRDAERLGPLHAADLVRTLGKWFGAAKPGYHTCTKCGGLRSWLCDLCPDCVRALP